MGGEMKQVGMETIERLLCLLEAHKWEVVPSHLPRRARQVMCCTKCGKLSKPQEDVTW